MVKVTIRTHSGETHTLGHQSEEEAKTLIAATKNKGGNAWVPVGEGAHTAHVRASSIESIRSEPVPLGQAFTPPAADPEANRPLTPDTPHPGPAAPPASTPSMPVAVNDPQGAAAEKAEHGKTDGHARHPHGSK